MGRISTGTGLVSGINSLLLTAERGLSLLNAWVDCHFDELAALVDEVVNGSAGRRV